MRNVIGRENLITCGRTNELTHAVLTEYSCDSLMADRMGLDGTMLHYLAVRKAMVSVHKPVHSKITLTYSLTWQADHCTSRRMAFNSPRCSPFLAFAQAFSALVVRKNCQNGLLLENSYVYSTVDYQSTTCVGTSTIRLRSIKSSPPFSLPLRHSHDKLFQALLLFHTGSSLVSRHPIFHARPAALSKNRVWTLSLRKLGHVYIWRSVNWGNGRYKLHYQLPAAFALPPKKICKLAIYDDA